MNVIFAVLSLAELKQNKLAILKSGRHGETCVWKEPAVFVHPIRKMRRDAENPNWVVRDVVAVPCNTWVAGNPLLSMKEIPVERRQSLPGFSLSRGARVEQFRISEQAGGFPAAVPTGHKNAHRRNKRNNNKNGGKRCGDLTWPETHADSVEEKQHPYNRSCGRM